MFMAFPALARVGRFSSGLLSSSLAGLELSVPGWRSSCPIPAYPAVVAR